MKKKVATVFGGSGFLGSHLADLLTKSGYETRVFDIYESKFIKNDQKMIVGDITNKDQVDKVIKGSNYVFHFAGIADLKEADENPLEAINYNIIGTANILISCVKNKISRIIFSSTVYVYSDKGGIYRTTKQSCEMLFENFYEKYDLDYTILRFGSLYGRRANNFNWMKKIISEALISGEMSRPGNGEEIRNYIHVEDAAKACLDILDHQYRNSFLIITGNQNLRIKDLLNMIKEMISNKVNIKYVEGDMDGHYKITPYAFRPRMAKKYTLNPSVELGQGILDTIYDVYKELEPKLGKKLFFNKIENKKIK